MVVKPAAAASGATEGWMMETAWLDSLRPWRRDDLNKDLEALALSAKLWGDLDHLTRQLSAATPEIPPGLDQRGLCTLLGVALLGIKFGGNPTLKLAQGTQIIVDGRPFTVHEARYEIVLRAIKSKAY
jgi:hypothetical protein